MARKNQLAEEGEIVAQISSIFPTFLDGIPFGRADADPPDFLGKSKDGRKVGLELTSWLNERQVRAAKGRERMRIDLLKALGMEKYPHPRYLCSAVIVPLWKRVQKNHYLGLCLEFHAATQRVDDAWQSLRDGHWRMLGPEERFDYAIHESEIKRYPILAEYVSSIWFTEPRGSDAIYPERSWISILPDGGLYHPEDAIGALRTAIQSKIDYYGQKDQKAHLDAQRFHKLYLLVHADPTRSSYNTPYQTCSQLMISPVEGLIEAAGAATEGLGTEPRVFDGIFLFYHLWNAGWLAQIWPTLERIPATER